MIDYSESRVSLTIEMITIVKKKKKREKKKEMITITARAYAE